MCFGFSKELSHLDGSFEYPQNMFCMRNKNIFLFYAILSGGLVSWWNNSNFTTLPVDVNGLDSRRS